MANPFRNYLTPDKFPGQLRNTATVTLGSLLVPYPQYGAITQTNTRRPAACKTHTFELRAQRPFTQRRQLPGRPMRCNDEQRQEWFDDIAQYQVLHDRRRRGLGVAAGPTLPVHRVTGGASPGRSRSAASSAYLARHADARSTPCIGGWQYTGRGALLLGPAVLFNTSYVVDGDPTLDNPTRDRVVRHQRCSRCRTRSRRAATRGSTTG